MMTGSKIVPKTLIEHLPAATLPGPAWLVGVREHAARSLREVGLPHRKVEAWRTVPLKPLVAEAYSPAAAAEVPGWATELLPADDGCHRVWLVNGRAVPTGEVPAGLRIDALAAAVARDDADLTRYLGAVARSEHFAALNAALFEDGVLVRVEPGVVLDRPVHIIHVGVSGNGPTVAYPRVLVHLRERAQAVVIETYLGDGGAKHLTNVVTEVALEPGSQLEHVRVQLGGDTSHHVGVLAVRQDRASVYRSRTISLGGAMARLDLDVLLAGEGAECELDGLYHATGREFVDNHTRVDHAVPHCSSRESYRGIVDGSAHAVFDGTAIVRRDAQRSAAHQENRNLLLSADATVSTKPHLEIDADDIVASHGATVGALDDDQLFYLRTRGIELERARAVLTYGFVQAIVDEVSHPPIAAWLGAALRARLPHGATIEELLS
ncbi:MAG TPA: Fe-S cluster assembly protein SufD [Kofleriaceae bacterium]|nr:Fe-S cluster assembly protein SufD [Kofleriaceae bacterium]